MTNFSSWLPARWLVVFLALLASVDPVLGQAIPTPTVTTTVPVTSTIAEDQAPLGGNVTSDGGAPAGTLSAGVVYSLNNGSLPTLNMSGSTPVYISSSAGSYSRLVSGLTASVTYAFRAFATNSAGTSYGAVRYFATRPVTPSVTVQSNGGNPSVSASITSSTPTYVAVVDNSSYGKDNVTVYVAPAGGTATPLSASIAGGFGYPFHAYTAVQSTPLADGTYTVYATATNNWGVTNGTSGTITSTPQPTDIKTFTVDGTAPTLTSITSTAVTAGSTVNSTAAIPFTVVLSEKVVLTTTTTVTATNGTVSALSLNSTGTTLTFSVTPTAAGTITLTIPAGAVRDQVGNPNAATSPFSFTYLAPVPPTVTTNTPDPAGVLETSAALGGTVTSDGGAPVTARGIVFGAGGTPTLGNPAYGNFPASTSGTGSYTVLVSNLMQYQGYVYRAYATNSAGTSYGDVIIFATKPNPPTVVVPANGAVLNTRTPTYNGIGRSTDATVYVGQTVASATPLPLVASNSGSGFSVTQPANAPLADGTYVVFATVLYGASPASDRSNVNTFTIDATAPTATISSSAGATGSNTTTTPIPFTVTFSEAVTGFIASDVTASNGTVNASSFSGSGTTYSFTVTPTTAGTATTVSVAANVAQDVATNGNAASSLFTLTYAPLVAPTVTTAKPGTSTAAGIILGGNVTSAGSTPVIERGILYSTFTNATINSSATKISIGSGTGSYAQQILASNFLFASSYYVRAYVTNSQGTSYGADEPFVTAIAPTVTTAAASSITSTSAVLGGNVTDVGTLGVLARGVVYSTTNTTPTTNDTNVLIANGGSTGPFSQTVSGLVPGTTYYARAYALNTPYSSGTGYGSTVTFTTTSNAPTVTSLTSTAGTSGSTTGTTPLPFSVTFSAAVTGFSTSGIVVTNGTVTSGPSGSGTTYTFVVTPTTSGTATTVTIAANAAQDATGTGNVASAPYSLTYAAPVTASTWTGAISTDWYTAGNWTAGVPTNNIDASIPVVSSRNYPVIGSNIASARNLTLNSGATLTQTGGTFDVRANWTSNGTFSATGGTVLLGTTTLANIYGSSNTRFWNLTTGASGAQLSTSAGTSIQRVVTLNGDFATQSNPLTLESNSTGTAMVANIVGVITGNVTVQRYIVPDLNPNEGYRQVSSPIRNATVASLTTPSFTPIVNPAYNTSSTPSTVVPFPTVYGYDQSRLATTNNNLATFDKGWYSSSSQSDELTVGHGFTIMIGANQTWNFTGAQNNGNVALNLSRNTGPTTADAGLALVGNPYPSPLDWSRVASTDRPGVEGTIYVWASNNPADKYAGNYSFYSNGIGNISPVLPLGQAFFVRVSRDQTSGTLNLNNSHRPTTYSNNTYHRTAAETRPLVQLALQGVGSPIIDDAFVYFENGATNGFDARYDAEKLVNPSGLNLSTSLSASQRLSIDGRGLPGTTQQVVPLAVGVPTAGSYSLSAAQLLNLGATPVYLRDLQLGTMTDLRQQPSYQFTVSNASALLTGRFELVLSPQQALATLPTALAQQVALYPNPAKKAAFVELPASLGRQAVTATLVDALGRQVRTIVLPAQGAVAHQLDLTELATGIYALRLSTSAGVVVKKLIVE
jgi:hypothetical protein